MISWHRFYDPSSGRYISADPIGLAGGMNLYAYVGGDPINWIDPNGLLVGDVTKYTTPIVEGAKKGSRFGPVGTAIGVGLAISGPVTLGDGTLEGKQCDDNPCSGYPSRSVAFSQAANYAGLSANWNRVGWDQYNYPSDKNSQISYTQLRQRIGNDPYGYRSLDGGEVVEHPADGDHPCPHFHAKKGLSDSSERFPYDPNKS